MGVLGFLSRGFLSARSRRRQEQQVRVLVTQAFDAVETYTQVKEQERIFDRRTEIMLDLQETTGTSVSLIRWQAQLFAFAQSISLLVWDVLGERLDKKSCIRVAQALVILELWNAYKNLPRGSKARDWTGGALTKQVVAGQASVHVTMCFEGFEDDCREQVRRIVAIAKLPTDEAVAAAMDELVANNSLEE